MNDHKKKQLVAKSLTSDPRVLEAKKILLEAVRSHKNAITGIRPANPDLEMPYLELLSDFSEQRGAKVWFPYLGSGIGNGALVELLDGSVKYDFITGIGVHYLGHSHLEMVEAGIDAAISDTIMQGNLQQNGDSAVLVSLIKSLSKMDHCFLSTSGAMACENALKIAFQKRYPAYRVLAFEHAFAGRTLALSRITDKPAYREGLPPTITVDYIPFFDSKRPEESTKQSINALKEYLKRYPKEHALMCFELVQGEAGFYPGSKDFFQSIMQILKDHHISIFVDEVQTFGRTPQLFAFQYYELQNFVDIVTIGKLTQVCATLFNKDHQPRPGLLSQTFTGSTSSIQAAIRIIQFLMKGDYFGTNGKIVKLFEYFSQRLSDLEKKYPESIKGPFGIGAMIAFTVFDGSYNRAVEFTQALFNAGVMSFIAGTNPTRVRFLVPAGVVTPNDIDSVIQIIEETLIRFRL